MLRHRAASPWPDAEELLLRPDIVGHAYMRELDDLYVVFTRDAIPPP